MEFIFFLLSSKQNRSWFSSFIILFKYDSRDSNLTLSALKSWRKLRLDI